MLLCFDCQMPCLDIIHIDPFLLHDSVEVQGCPYLGENISNSFPNQPGHANNTRKHLALNAPHQPLSLTQAKTSLTICA